MNWRAVLFDEKEVPRKVLMKIFLMLPWPDLLRCGRVCRGWKLILSSKAFTAFHLENQKEHLLVKAGDPLEGKTSTFTLICKQSLNEVEHYQLLPNPHMSHSMLVHNTILGSCNGILCLHCHRDLQQRIVLWNPVTNEFKIPTLPENLSTSTCVFGFGFDPETNDYKVVAAKEIEVVPLYEFYVYNLSTGCWRRSLNDRGGGVIKRNMKIKQRGSSCTGNAFSWWIMEGEKDHSRILSFVMASEKIILTSLPYGIRSNNNGELVRYDQSLAVIYNDCNVHTIWVLGELGVEESWTCKFKIGRLLPEESTALWSFNTVAPVITAFITQHHDGSGSGSGSVHGGGVFLGRERSTFIPGNQFLFQQNNISEIVFIDLAINKKRKRTSVYKFRDTKAVFQLCSIKKSLVPLINAAET
ncbi:F-box protein At3g07870-like [Ziziphus jujuba]|uniref:F-box protein At3g07870-like n=1 Tax=Ziziphus jujuba TaxID=326968 RepID=A0ABM3IB06_ZIZJJ|nr:F-box protein At3g07870-like [Ziziphus jujuba]